MSITNLQLSVIMSAYTNGPYDYFPDTETYREQVTILLDEGIIEPSPVRANNNLYKYCITEKGKFYLENLLAIPFPVETKSWEIPK